MAENKQLFKGLRQVSEGFYNGLVESAKTGYLWFVKRDDESENGGYGEIFLGTRHYGHFGNEALNIATLSGIVVDIKNEMGVLPLAEGQTLADLLNSMSGQIETIGAEQITGVTFNGNLAEVTNKVAAITFTQDEYNLVKQEVAESGCSSTYYLTKNGAQVGDKINITKDQFLKEAKFFKKKEDAEAAGKTVPKGTEFPALYFKFETLTGDSETWVSVKELVDIYEAGKAIEISANTINVKVAEGADKNFLKINNDNALEVKSVDTDAAILQDTIQVTENVGQLKDGQVLTSGMSVYDILVKMLSQEKWAASVITGKTFTATIGKPTITKAVGDTVEVGTVVSLTGTSNEAYNYTQSVSAQKFDYGYKVGAEGTFNSATSYTENLKAGAVVSGQTCLKTTLEGFSGITGQEVTAETINVNDAIIIEGTNKVNLFETGKTVYANKVVNGKEFYVATNLKNYTKSATDKNPWVVTIPSVWNGVNEIIPTNNNAMTITGKYYYYFGSLANLGLGLDDATETAIKALPKNWITKDGTTSPAGATSTGTIVMAVPTKYKLATIQEDLSSASILDKFITKEMDLEIGGGNKAKYRVYLYKDQAAYVKYKNVTITKA